MRASERSAAPWNRSNDLHRYVWTNHPWDEVIYSNICSLLNTSMTLSHRNELVIHTDEKKMIAAILDG